MLYTDLSKNELRAILANPSIDTTQSNWIAKANRLKSKREYMAIVYPIIEEHCIGIISLDDFKKRKIIPHKVVKIILEKCA